MFRSTPSTSLRRATAGALALASLTAAASAGAAPTTPSFGKAIDPVPTYDGQSICDPTAKPGTLALRDLLKKAYPTIGDLGITRDCSIGGASEHKEGRALDWAARWDDPAQQAAGRDFIAWLMAPDEYGNTLAMARRLGIMYLIWGQHIWNPSEGFMPDPDTWRSYTGPDPHISHMHISLTWDGAYEQTTWWGGMPASAPAKGAGYWVVTNKGFVFDYAATTLDPVPVPLTLPIVGAAPTSTHAGFWGVAADGGIFSFGDAAFYGSMGGQRLNKPVVGMAATPTGKGYWQVASDGGIFAFGDAGFYGSMGGQRLNKPVVGMAATPTGKGYWLVASDGGLFSFGDAGFFGSLGSTPLNQPVAQMLATSTGKGYWMVAKDGGVFTFGDAAFVGSGVGRLSGGTVTSLAPTPTGKGYWMLTTTGAVLPFGDAQVRGSSVRSGTTAAGIVRYG